MNFAAKMLPRSAPAWSAQELLREEKAVLDGLMHR
jgi:hypothetical protein